MTHQAELAKAELAKWPVLGRDEQAAWRLPWQRRVAVSLPGSARRQRDQVPACIAAVSGRYGFMQDELYFIDAGRHLAFGYVDQPPLMPLLDKATAIFGMHPTAFGAGRLGAGPWRRWSTLWPHLRHYG